MYESQAGRPALYDEFVPAFLEFVRCHRGRRTTHQIENGLGKFCECLVRSGVSERNALTPSHVRGFLSSLEGYRPATIAVHASTLRSFLAYMNFKGILGLDLSYAVERPRLYRWSQPPRVLDPETIELLLASLDRSTPLGKRDYAILLLAARYGLRSSDIRSLRFENIHWREDRMALLQSKTQRHLELPLLADVATALVDYVRQGRPACVVREIFVRHVPPIQALAMRNNFSFACSHSNSVRPKTRAESGLAIFCYSQRAVNRINFNPPAI